MSEKEPLRIQQVCRHCAHVQTVTFWGQSTWQCSRHGCKKYNDIKTEINMKEAKP